MIRLKLLSDVTTALLARMLKGEFEVVETEGFGAYAEEILAPKLPKCDYTILVLKGEARIPIPEDIQIVRVPDGPEYRDEKSEALSGSPWSLKGLEFIVDEIRRAVVPKKVLALDFDNTLWRGIVGEVGVDGIEPNLPLQELALELKAKGVLLVGVSKNNPDDVAGVWQREDMKLKADDLVAARVNWEPKSRNLEAIADELRLGLDSFVFADDRPIERERMREAHPEVTVLDPVDQDSIRRAFVCHLADGAPDRTEDYRLQAKRLGEYRASLEIKTDIHPVRPDEYARVAELSRRANQFNLTTRRWGEADVKAKAETSGVDFKVIYSSDKYGDLGLVGYGVAEAGRITDFVISCRAMGRRHEYELYAALGSLPLDFAKTDRNAPAERFVKEVQG
jgi:FkbH-like protein